MKSEFSSRPVIFTSVQFTDKFVFLGRSWRNATARNGKDVHVLATVRWTADGNATWEISTDEEIHFAYDEPSQGDKYWAWHDAPDSKAIGLGANDTTAEFTELKYRPLDRDGRSIYTGTLMPVAASTAPSTGSADRADQANAKTVIYRRKYNEAADLCTAELGLHPDDAGLLQKRATFYAAAGKFRESAADYAEVARKIPDNIDMIYRSACLDLYIGDMPAYEADRGIMLRRFGETDSSAVARRTAKALLMATS